MWRLAHPIRGRPENIGPGSGLITRSVSEASPFPECRVEPHGLCPWRSTSTGDSVLPQSLQFPSDESIPGQAVFARDVGFLLFSDELLQFVTPERNESFLHPLLAARAAEGQLLFSQHVVGNV